MSKCRAKRAFVPDALGFQALHPCQARFTSSPRGADAFLQWIMFYPSHDCGAQRSNNNDGIVAKSPSRPYKQSTTSRIPPDGTSVDFDETSPSSHRSTLKTAMRTTVIIFALAIAIVKSQHFIPDGRHHPEPPHYPPHPPPYHHPTPPSYPGPPKGPSTTVAPPTATGANPTASGPTIDHGKAYYKYETVTGIFLQDENSTDPSTFLYNETNFGLVPRTYPSDRRVGHYTDWQRYNNYLSSLNRRADRNEDYKLLFIARHSEGFHNAEESFAGTPAWNCYYAELPGNQTATWEDAALTNFGRAQAVVANNFWREEIYKQKIRTPDSYYTSPLDRCLSTANLTFSTLPLPRYKPFRPVVKELLREGMSIHTCDRRSSRDYISRAYPRYRFEETFTETDELWNGITAETSSAQDYRSKVVLDDIFSHDRNEIISITSHSGESASLLRVLGHRDFSLTTGAIIPVLVKAVKVYGHPAASTTMPWTTSAWCTNGPPVTSLASSGCVCMNGVPPTTASPTINPRK